MFHLLSTRAFVFGLCISSIAMLGCSEEEAVDQAKDLQKSAEEAADQASEKTAQVVDQGKKLASKLGDKSVAFFGTVKTKIGNLDELKEKPAELKAAVSDLLAAMDEKSEEMQLPEKSKATLETVKEKLVALQTYLEGEVEQAKIEEHLQAIKDAVKSGLGMSSE